MPTDHRYAADAIAGGKWLGAWLTVTAAVANSGSFLSEMTVTSQTLVGMAERGLLPRKLLEESPHGTRPYALGVIALLIAVSQPLDFHALVLVCECAVACVSCRVLTGMCLAWHPSSNTRQSGKSFRRWLA